MVQDISGKVNRLSPSAVQNDVDNSGRLNYPAPFPCSPAGTGGSSQKFPKAWGLCVALAVFLLFVTIPSGNMMARDCVYFDRELRLYLAADSGMVNYELFCGALKERCPGQPINNELFSIRQAK